MAYTKIRFLGVGAVELLISIVLYVVKGFHPAYLGLMVIGVVLVILGLIWK